MRTLMLMRHAKSDWSGDIVDDFTRPLAKRGRLAAKQMGDWMRLHHIKPDRFISSPAVRARETARIISNALRVDPEQIYYEDRLYLADVDALLNIVGDCPREIKSIMLMGHNPGLEEFLTYLCGEDVPTSATGKLLPTASLAQISLSNDWRGLEPRSGRLIAVTRPKEL